MRGVPLTVLPRYTLQQAPAAAVVVIPGGDVVHTLQSPEIIAWIRARAPETKHVMSVCTGAHILAATGLLHGLRATTFYDQIDGLARMAPNVQVVADQRYVDNGKFITTAGLSSGIDGALHVVAKLRGLGEAQKAALNMEYDWKPDSTYARASFADRPIRKVLGRALRLPAPHGAQVQLLSTGGTTQHWEVTWTVTGNATPAEVLQLLGASLAAGQWQEAPSTRSPPHQKAWTLREADGTAWTGVTAAAVTAPESCTVRWRVARADEAGA